ncbi:MAG: SprT-like domain-containing protein [Lachnospiraceae bacterium]|nr:SprT-like domain-containing protein [Lachnospiraceae bacterium]
MFPRGGVLLAASGRREFLSATETRLRGEPLLWEKRLLARDLIGSIGPMLEKILREAGLPARLRRIVSVRITRGVREYGSCNIPKADDSECRLAFSGHLFFEGNAEALIDVVAHELLHACLPSREGHGVDFHRGMALLNEKLGLHIQVYSEKSAIRQSESLYRYKVVCTACRNEFYYLRAGAVVRHPSRYRCAKCGKNAFKVYRILPSEKEKGSV